MKNFDEWNEIKKTTQSLGIDNEVHIYEREVWWAKLGINIGDEEDGKGSYFERPVLIIKKHNPRCFLGMSLSTINKDSKYYYTIALNNDFVSVILSQIKLMGSERLINCIGNISANDFEEIKKVASKTSFG